MFTTHPSHCSSIILVKVHGGEELYHKLLTIVLLERHELHKIMEFTNLHDVRVVLIEKISVERLLRDHGMSKLAINLLPDLKIKVAIEPLI